MSEASEATRSFSHVVKCVLAEAAKLKSLVVDQADFGRDAAWLALIKATCAHTDALLAELRAAARRYNAALKRRSQLKALDVSPLEQLRHSSVCVSVSAFAGFRCIRLCAFCFSIADRKQKKEKRKVLRPLRS